MLYLKIIMMILFVHLFLFYSEILLNVLYLYDLIQHVFKLNHLSIGLLLNHLISVLKDRYMVIHFLLLFCLMINTFYYRLKLIRDSFLIIVIFGRNTSMSISLLI
jgi:hypothetical protein